MVSVTGLAPVRPCLKGRMRELLCIHGLKILSEKVVCFSDKKLGVPGGVRSRSLLVENQIC